MTHYNEDLWWESDSYCVAVGLAFKLMNESDKFFVREPASADVIHYDDIVLAFSKWLKEGSG